MDDVKSSVLTVFRAQAKLKKFKKHFIFLAGLLFLLLLGMVYFNYAYDTPLPKHGQSAQVYTTANEANKEAMQKIAALEIENQKYMIDTKAQLQEYAPKVTSKLIDKQLYSSGFFEQHKTFAKSVINFCSNHALSTQNALTNCNTASASQNVLVHIPNKLAQVSDAQLKTAILWMVASFIGFCLLGFVFMVLRTIVGIYL